MFFQSPHTIARFSTEVVFCEWLLGSFLATASVCLFQLHVWVLEAAVELSAPSLTQIFLYSTKTYFVVESDITFSIRLFFLLLPSLYYNTIQF